LKELVVRTLVLKHLPPELPHDDRPMAPGGGLVIAAAISILLWAMIAGLIAIV
jgi:hypothetical protein